MTWRAGARTCASSEGDGWGNAKRCCHRAFLSWLPSRPLHRACIARNIPAVDAAGADTCSKPLKPFKLSDSTSSSVRLMSRQPPRVPMYFASKTAAMPEPVVGQIPDDRLTFRRRYGSQQFGRGCVYARFGRGIRSGLCPRPLSDAVAFPSTPPGGRASIWPP
jgi:hypothetical protein